MIVVLAHGDDDQVTPLLEEWEGYNAVHLSPDDLSSPGWTAPFPGRGGTFVAEGRQYDVGAISGVLVRLAGVYPVELRRVVASDRPYAASEMTAFLAHWLSTLPDPVVNRPSPAFLLGPAWSTEEWITHAAGVGLPTPTLLRNRASRPSVPPRLWWATVVGDHVVGEAADGSLVEGLRALAAAAGVQLMAAGFDAPGPGGRLVQVTLCPPVLDEPVRNALLDIFLGQCANPGP